MNTVYGKIQQVDILAIGIHPDDVELSASGTILSHIDRGYTVGICDLTQGELGSFGTPEIRIAESQIAAEILNVRFRINLKMADGFSIIDRTHILRIAEVIRLCRPKVILANALDDRHPDHPRGSKMVREAFFFSGLRSITSIQGEAFRADALYYYIQDIQLTPDFCVDVTSFIEGKWNSIRAFKTQFFRVDQDATPISSLSFVDFMEGKMRVFGRPIGAKYAEGFNVHRTIGVPDLVQLL